MPSSKLFNKYFQTTVSFIKAIGIKTTAIGIKMLTYIKSHHNV